MFKLTKLHIIEHPFLGELTFNFISKGEESNGPYTTVLIGKNGTGKSLILRIIADIFEDLKNHFLPITRYRNKISYSYDGQLYYDNSFIDFDYTSSLFERSIPTDITKRKFEFHFYKDGNPLLQNADLSPNRLAVSAYLVSDKFRFASKDKKDFYIYLGLRETANSAGTKSYLNRIIPFVIDYIKNKDSLDSLKASLEFLEFDKDFFEVEYKCRYKYYFFNGNLTDDQFEDLLINWKKFSKRKEPPRYIDYFSSSVKGKKELITKLVDYLNELAKEYNIRIRGNSFVKINLLKSNLYKVELLQILNRLDLLESPGIILSKNENLLNLQQASSGEFHYFTSILGLLTNITENSLVLIDEPEISFHPNWQLKYIYYLKQIFKNYKTCHFILATHSHFMISDLEPENSNVLRLVRNPENKLLVDSIKESTYGMSAEEILYRVFELRTYRNYFFEIELRELLHLLSNKEKDPKRITNLISNLRKVEFDKNDPLTQILKEADEYLKRL